MNTETAQVFIRCYAVLWFLVGAYFAITLLRSAIMSDINGFMVGLAVMPFLLSAIAAWLWFARDVWAKRIITIVLGLYATMFVLGRPWLALISLILMAVTLWATKYTQTATSQQK